MNLRAWLVLLLGAACALQSCAKKYSVEANPGAAESKMAVVQRGADNTLAYEHELRIEADSEQIASRVEAIRAACAADTQSKCTILDVSVNSGEGYASGTIKMRLAPMGVDPLVRQASTDARVLSRQTSAEDLALPLADVKRQLDMLVAYRERLSALLARKDAAVSDVITIAKELAATQTQIEQLSGEHTQLRRRIDTDLLTIRWQAPPAQVRAADTPIRDALSAFGATFGYAVAEVIDFIAVLVPWLVIGLPSLILLRWFWRWSGRWLTRKLRAEK